MGWWSLKVKKKVNYLFLSKNLIQVSNSHFLQVINKDNIKLHGNIRRPFISINLDIKADQPNCITSTSKENKSLHCFDFSNIALIKEPLWTEHITQALLNICLGLGTGFVSGSLPYKNSESTFLLEAFIQSWFTHVTTRFLQVQVLFMYF